MVSCERGYAPNNDHTHSAKEYLFASLAKVALAFDAMLCPEGEVPAAS